MSPATAIALGRLGGLPVLDLEGVWTRYDDPEPSSTRSPSSTRPAPPRGCSRSTPSRSRPELITERLRELRAAGVTVAGALSPKHTQAHWRTVVDAGVDLFVIRGTTVSAEHVSSRPSRSTSSGSSTSSTCPSSSAAPSTYTAALHLMRTGAAGVLVGFGGGAAHTTRRTLGIHAPDGLGHRRRRRRPARLPRRVRRPLRPRHRRRRRRHVGRRRQGDRLRLRRGHARCRPGPRHRSPGRRLPLGVRGTPPVAAARRAGAGRGAPDGRDPLRPWPCADGTTNIIGALRRAMATTGYSDVKEFQRVEVVLAPHSHA
jgi:IMP dehydrogenase